MPRRHTTWLLAILLGCLPLDAVADDHADLYATHYGDGIRAYTEARYDDALRELYRAFAVRQSPLALKLIIRSHDFQGNCSARKRAAEMLSELFDGQDTPPPQLCRTVGTLRIECAAPSGTVVIDGKFEVECGSAVDVPVGEHRIQPRNVAAATVVEVEANQSTEIAVTPDPRKWYLGDAGPHKWMPLDIIAGSKLRMNADMPETFAPPDKVAPSEKSVPPETVVPKKFVPMDQRWKARDEPGETDTTDDDEGR